MKKTVFLLVVVLTPFLASSQDRDSIYSYYVCIHKELKLGKAIVKTETEAGNSLETPKIEGIVFDLNKKAILTSTVTLKYSNNDTLVRRTVLDSSNRFSLTSVPTGIYAVRVSSSNYVSTELTDITLDKGTAISIIFTLGTNDMFIYKKVTSKKHLSERKLNRRARRLERKINK